MSNILRCVLCLASVLMISACATPLPPKAPPPQWIQNPKSDDGMYMYRLGMSSAQPTEESARQAAYADALANISKEIYTVVSTDGQQNRLSSTMTIKQAEILPGCIYYDKKLEGYSCWLQVAFPIAERNKIKEQLAIGEKVNAMWTSALSDFHSSKMDSARDKLLQILGEQPKALGTVFGVDEVKLTLGDAYRQNNDNLAARQHYEAVIQTSTTGKWKAEAEQRLNQLPPPPIAWKLKDRWANQPVSLICLRKDENAGRAFPDLVNSITKYLNEAKLKNADSSSALDANACRALFTATDMSPQKNPSAITIIVLCDTDPAKRGKTTDVFGTATPMIDTIIKFFVLRTDGSTLLNGQFKEVAGSNPDTTLADRAASILIRNYLVPKCPSVK